MGPALLQGFGGCGCCMWEVPDPSCVGGSCDVSALASGEALFPSCFHWRDVREKNLQAFSEEYPDFRSWINPTWSSAKTPGLAGKLHPLASACVGTFHPSWQGWDPRQERDVGTGDTPKSTGAAPGSRVPQEWRLRGMGAGRALWARAVPWLCQLS